jgi:hypothetical protein
LVLLQSGDSSSMPPFWCHSTRPIGDRQSEVVASGTEVALDLGAGEVSEVERQEDDEHGAGLARDADVGLPVGGVPHRVGAVRQDAGVSGISHEVHGVDDDVGDRIVQSEEEAAH